MAAGRLAPAQLDMPMKLRKSTRSIARAVVAFTSCSLAARAQSQLEWLGYHDGPQSQSDFGRSVAVDAAGNVYVSGRSYNPSTGVPPLPPSADFEVVKFSPTGTELWSARKDAFGGEDFGLDCQISPAGDVYVSGYGWSGNNIDSVLLKFSSGGVLQWMRVYSSPAGTDFGRAIAFDAAGNVLVCGNSYGPVTGTDVLIESYSPAGALNWSTTFDGGASNSDAAYAITVLASGEIALAGQLTHATSGGDFAVWKLDSGGSVAWTTTLDGGSSLADAATTIVVGPPGKLIAGGYGGSSANGPDWMIARIDVASGAVDWSALHDGTAHGGDNVRSLAVDASGVVWACGGVSNAGTGVDFVTRRYGPTGAVLSTETWNNALVNRDDQLFRVLLGNAGQAWVCGFTTLSTTPPTSYDAVVVQYDTSGAPDWFATYSSAGTFDDRPFDMELAPANRIAMGGYTASGPTGGFDYLAMQIDLSDAPHGYCTAKTNSLGCVPVMTFTGSPSVAAASGFAIVCTSTRNQKSGLLFYSVTGANNAPFQGGFMCVQAPTARTPITSSGGNAPPADDCSGAFSIDMNAFAAGALGGTPAPQLAVAGTAVYCQEWSRDPGASFQTNLSSAIRYVVLP